MALPRKLPHADDRRPLQLGFVSFWLIAFVIGSLAVSVCSCGSDNGDSLPPRLAVLSAFPAELAAVLEHATVDDTVDVDGRVFRLGRLGRVPVVLGLTGIGLVNAANTTHAMLDRFQVAGVVVSGVAGSTLQIGDVVVPAAWELKDGTTYPVDQDWLAQAEQVAAPGVVSLERCAVVSTLSPPQQVCMLQEPAVVVGGVGQSTDPFGNKPFPCQPGGGDLYGCDLAPTGTASSGDVEPVTPSSRLLLAAYRGARVSGTTSSGSGGDGTAMGTEAALTSDAPAVNDMETAAIAREAAARGVRFIGFRAVSDGAGDPLNLPGFPTQFSAYYHFAAHNAAAAAATFIERLRP
jgi:nucleoside phosphorylase